MKWVRGKTIGHGSFAAVSLAKPINQNSEFPSLIAVKTCGVSLSDSLSNEGQVLQQLKDCPQIINCYGDSMTIENNEKLYNLALEYASGGALSDKVKSLRLSENEVRKYTCSILKGVEFIHRNGFVHCDIKLDNILLVNEDGKEIAKIADFGLAKRANLSSTMYDVRGTPMYMSPETVRGGEQEAASDIWAVGCLVTEMITGNPVWNCSDFSALVMKIGVGSEIPKIPAKLSEDGKDFLEKCFVKNPLERWTAEMLLDHPFVKNITFDKEVGNQISPRDVFDFPDWETEESLCLTVPEFGLPTIAPAMRLGQLLTDQKPNWSSSVSNSWVKVR
ncbi:mitogen-activated protein kinase kinase kinase 20-like [Rutidosis leptorrhynchoides]|uniref:mitogen-activated protein kinase kinase kinase 20-like n=1 Tax=Rutidosis leptorrhynchoides TaxID=125765 RepID=UPI003A995363